MQHIKNFFLFVCLCVFANANAQLSTNEKPVSFERQSELTVISKSSTPIVTTPKLDMAKITKEDEEDDKYDMPLRFGYSHIVNYDLNNSGIWYEFPNGDKLWQLNVVCPGALSVNFCYDKFWIPEGGKFFVYSKDRKHIIGAFTSKNNNGDKEKVRGFATELIYGDDVVLEYYQPKETTNDAIISIEYIVHGYRDVRLDEMGYGASDPCMVNVNCSEGQNWQNEKKAVARVLLINSFFSGFLIATTSLSGEPFFLTANHCMRSKGRDAISNQNLDDAVFYWNYETAGCANGIVEPSNYQTTNGATLVANPYENNAVKLDFALLRLTGVPVNYTPYYLGWDKSGQSGDSCVCIHHPMGDVKKISTSLSQPAQGNYPDNSHDNLYWDVDWDVTEHGHGVVNPGSSGSPLLNDMHRVIGHMRRSDMENCNHTGYSLFGKLEASWTGNNIHADSIHRRLNCWLDSLHSGTQTTIEGVLVIPSYTLIYDNQQFYNIRVTSSGELVVLSNVQLMGNSRVIVESGGQLLIQGGKLSNVDLVLKPGATLRITEGGILYTRNGFEAPGGAYVSIDNGRIL